MGTNWDLYNKRLNVNGFTQRERTINNFKSNKDKIGINSPLSKIVSIETSEKKYIDIPVFINSKIKKNEKSISPVMSTDSLIFGNKVKWKNADWLITELNLDDDVFVDGIMILCNYTLPFQTNSSTIFNEPCIVIDATKSSSTGEDEGKIITLSNTQRAILIQYNKNTKYLIEGKRIFIDQLTNNPKVYKITKVDRITHMNGNHGLLQLTCDECEVISNKDKPEIKIADYIFTEPVTPPVPSDVGMAVIVNTKNVTYTTNIKIKIGTSEKPFVSLFKDLTGNIVPNVQPKWDLILPNELADKVEISYKSKFPSRCYVSVNFENELIGHNFELHLTDNNNSYGECVLKCEVTSLYG